MTTMTSTTETTTAHLEAVANAALQSYLPSGWHIHWLADANYADAYGNQTTHVLYTPQPRTPGLLFVLLHELGHLANHDPGNKDNFFGTEYFNPPHSECIASHWAKTYMLAHKLEVPPECWAEARHMWQNEEEDRHEKRTKD